LYYAGHYLTLHRTRQHGMAGPQPLAVESLAAYLQFFPQHDPLKFFEVMLAVDAHYLADFAEKQSQRQERQQGQGKAARPR
jgi:hypothetical protein